MYRVWSGAAAMFLCSFSAVSVLPCNAVAQNRDALENRGVVVAFSYTLEGFAGRSLSEHPRDSAAVLGSFASTVDVDLHKMGVGRGQIFFSGQALHGQGISEDGLGALQPASNLEAPRLAKMMEAWYADSDFKGKLRIKAGRQYADTDFGLIEIGGPFLNASNGALPTAPMPTYPDAHPGVSAAIEGNSYLSWGIGVFGGSSRPLTILETRIRPFPGDSSQRAVYRAGVWHRGKDPSREGEPGKDNYGVYGAADHWLHQREDGGGPAVFARWGWTPAGESTASKYAGAGFLYEGQNAAGFAMNLVAIGSKSAEVVYEWFYRRRLSDRITLQPDLQWMRHIAGDERSALVAGLRLSIEF